MTRFVWLVDIGVLEMIGKGNLKKKLSFLQSQGNPPNDRSLLNPSETMESYKAVD